VKWLHKLLLEIPTQLETERLVIRRYAEGDGQGLYLLLERNDNRNRLAEHVDEATEVRTAVEAEIRIRQWVADWVARTRFVMGICLKSSNEQIGQIWIEPRNWDVPSFELGWFLDSGFWGKGLAAEAANCAMKFIFECLHAHKIIVITRDNNERSYRLAQRLGFHREGYLRECSIKNGLRWGLFHYGMLRSEYETHVEGAAN
jgi:RimJ/RimL family protein N-acetyltransferase